jgi:acetyl esterase/lipase
MEDSPFYEQPLITPPAGRPAPRIWRDLPYREEDDPVTRLDIYRPAADPPAGGYPLLVFLHGGPLGAGRDQPWPKEWRVFQDYGRLAAEQGLAAAVINHRYVNYDWLVRAIEDVAQALKVIGASQESYGVNAARYALWAFSGAGMLLSPFLDGDIPGLRAVACFYPMLDLTHVEQAMAAYSDEELIALSPLSHVELIPRDLPLLVARGGLDKPGLNRAIDSFVMEALSRNRRLEVFNLPFDGHSFDMFGESEAARSAVTDGLAFLKRHLFEDNEETSHE